MSEALSENRFCSRCGKRFVPLNVPFLSASCGDCGKTVHFVRDETDGKGVTINTGETFTIPSGYLRFSLDPASSGKLFRPGLPFLLKQFFLVGHPKSADEMLSFAEKLQEEANAILGASAKLKGFDLHRESDFEAVWEKLETENDSREWHAMRMGIFSKMLMDAIAKEEFAQAAFAGYLMGTFRGLTIVTEPLFEQTLWRGYLANQIVYEAAAAASHNPAEAEAIKRLEPLFRRLDEGTLHTWVESGLPIGPRIGVQGLPEEILRSLAKWHLVSIQRQREGARQAASDRRSVSELRLKWLGFGGSGGLALATAAVAVLKYFGVL
nr:hypothetical protein [Dechloromonas sp.]